MRRTFPVPSCDYSTSAKGFTFIEALIALAVTAILVAVAASALITSLRAEQFADQARLADRVCERLVTAHYAGYSTEGIVEETRSTHQITTTEVVSEQEWILWNVSPLARPSLSVQFAARRFN